MSALQLPDAKIHLNMTGSTNDTELQKFIDAAERYIAAWCGPLEPTTVVRRIRCDGAILVLPVTPVLSLTSVALSADGTPVDPAALSFDDLSGVVNASYSLAGIYTVTYEAGRLEVPEDLMMGVLELTRHLWRTQRGGAQRPGSTEQPASPGFLMPYAVAALIEPYRILAVA